MKIVQLYFVKRLQGCLSSMKSSTLFKVMNFSNMKVLPQEGYQTNRGLQFQSF